VFFADLQRRLGERLRFYVVTGGLGRGSSIPGWSDIDVLFGIDDYDTELIEAIGASLGSNTSGIKIGITFYSLVELRDPAYLDPKTHASMYGISKGVFVPRIKSDDVVLPDISLEFIVSSSMVNYSSHLHSLKKALINFDSGNERATYKCIITMLQVMMWDAWNPRITYDDVLALSRVRYPNVSWILPRPQDIIEHPEGSNERYESYVKFLNWVKDNHVAVR